jgi:glutamate synthase domain-containing protein 2/CDGSH-type Zn-finger protein
MKSNGDTARPSIECAPNGPLLVKNLDTLVGVDSRSIPPKPVVALCRCGRTAKRPFCDGTHAKVGFSDKKKDDRVPDRRDNYVGKRITIHDNRGICSHAGFCTGNLPAVWRMKTEPWIDPNAAAVKKIIETIEKCPSGALSYTLDDVEHPDLERVSQVKIVPHGPFVIQGGIELKGVNSLEGTSTEHRTLCRCGHSKNKPFCDGSHWYAKFRDDGRIRVAVFSELEDRKPTPAEVEGVDLVVIRVDKKVSVLTGICPHMGALMADGFVENEKLVCSLHEWQYDLSTGANVEKEQTGLHRFESRIENDEVLVVIDEITKWNQEQNQTEEAAAGAPAASPSFKSKEEPHNEYIQQLAKHGLSQTGPHGPTGAMGVPSYELPSWDDLQLLTAQLHRFPLLDETPVGTELVIGPKAKKPLHLKIPLFVSDMSFGSLSLEAKTALAKGAELAGTGICSGEGGMLPEEQAENSRYFYELASARFGFTMDKLDRVQAFHFKGGQAAKTGTGGHLPGNKVTEKIARVRGLQPGQDAVSPARFPDWHSLDDYKSFAQEVRQRTGGIPIGFKLSAQHIEKDIDAAIEVGVDYIILDGRGGGTGAAPLIFRDNISVPTIPALARARKHLDRTGHKDITLIITGGLRTPADFAKALALGADGVALANAVIQAIGCIGARVCNTNRCPAGVATQDEELRKRLSVDTGAQNLSRFLKASVQLMSILARACGHTHLNQFTANDLTTWKRDIACLTGISYGGVGPLI